MDVSRIQPSLYRKQRFRIRLRIFGSSEQSFGIEFVVLGSQSEDESRSQQNRPNWVLDVGEHGIERCPPTIRLSIMMCLFQHPLGNQGAYKKTAQKVSNQRD